MRHSLKEDAADLGAFEKRTRQPSHPFEKVLEDLRPDELLWYRIVYAVDDGRRAVEVVKIGHRREVYRR